MDFPGGSDGQASACNAGDTGFNPWVGKISWRRQWQPNPVLLPEHFHGRRSLVDCCPWGCKEANTTEQLHFYFLSQTKCFTSLKPTRFFNSINFYQIHVKSQNLQHTALMIPWRCFSPLSLIIPVIKCQPSKLFNNS